MAELDLYLTEDDELPIIASALEMGFEIIPDMPYSSDQYETLNTLDGYRLYRPRTAQFYFLSNLLFRGTLEMRKIEKQGEIRYVIVSPPLVSFMGGGIFEERGTKFIKQGYVAYSRFARISPELTNAYKSLTKIAKRTAPTRIMHGESKRVFWLGPQAKQAIEHGAKPVGFEKYSARELLP